MNTTQQNRLIEKCLGSESILFSQDLNLEGKIVTKCYLKQDPNNPCKYYSYIKGIDRCRYEKYTGDFEN